MEQIHYLRAFRRRWWVIVASVAVAVGAGWLTTETVAPIRPQADTYGATALLWNKSEPTAGQSSPVTVEALIRFSTLPSVLQLAAEELGHEGDPFELRSRVRVEPDPGGDAFLDITGVSADPKEAQQIASAFSAALIRYLQELQTNELERQAEIIEGQIEAITAQGGGEAQILALRTALDELAVKATVPVGLTVIQPPKAELLPETGLQPPESRTTQLLIAAVIGLLAGLGLVLVLERFDTRIRTRRKAEEHFGFPVLAEVPVLPRRQRKRVAVSVNPTGAPADAFRLLAAAVSLAPIPAGNGAGTPPGNGGRKAPRIVLVTSPGPGDGKTTVAANLAMVFGELGNRVVLVSCDLRRPFVHRLFQIPAEPGLADVLEGEGHVQPAQTSIDNVRVVPSGNVNGIPGELLASARMRQLIEQLRREADVVVLDTSPVLVSSDAAPLLAQADTVILVARANSSKVELAERTGEVLRQLGARVAGVALNRAKEISLPSGHYRHYQRSHRRERRKETSGV